MRYLLAATALLAVGHTAANAAPPEIASAHCKDGYSMVEHVIETQTVIARYNMPQMVCTGN